MKNSRIKAQDQNSAINTVMSLVSVAVFVTVAILIAINADAHGISSAVHF
jgi:hypothetical protein